MTSIVRDKFSILFDRTGYRELSNFIIKGKFQNILLLTDDNTRDNCLDIFMQSLCEIDQNINKIMNSIACNYSMKPGENSKNIIESNKIWEFLISKGFKRNSLIINIGGGMVSDIGGFVASTYMRGINFVNVPTTLLGMVDASIGGKTGIDFNKLKNIIGSFEFAKQILIDFSFLNSLSKKQFNSGFAEMIKHSLIDSVSQWEEIKKINSSDEVSKDMIYRSIQTKINIIENDPREINIGKHLNYGHTLGHAIETHLLGSDREILHGEAISIGLILETYISFLYNKIDYQKACEVKSFVNRFYKKIEFNSSDINKTIDLLSFDKKNYDDTPMFVLLNDIGSPVINQVVERKEIEKAFKYYND